MSEALSQSQLSPELRPEIVDLLLERAAIENPYASYAVGFYRSAIAAHESGQDLLQHLATLKTRGHYPQSLGEDKISFISAASGKDGDTFDDRYGFVYAEIESDKIMAYALSGEKLPSIQYRYEADAKRREKERRYSFNATKLNKEFDQQGRKYGRAEEINFAMANFSIGIDEPELAAHFVGRLTKPKNKLELYFATVAQNGQSNAAQLKVKEILSDLKTELQTSPKALCKFLVREIRELGSTAGINVEQNTKDVMTLATDPTIFDDIEYASLKSGNMRYELAKALMADNQEDLAMQVINSLPTRQKEFAYDGLLVKAEQGTLKWWEIRGLRLITQKADTVSKALSAWLALCVAGDKKKNAFRTNPNNGYGSPRQCIERNIEHFDTRTIKFQPKNYVFLNSIFPN